MTCPYSDQACVIPRLHPLEVCYLQKQAADRSQPFDTKHKPPTNLLLPARNRPWQNYLALHLLLQMSLRFHHAAHIGSVKTSVSPALGIHPCCSQWNTHICVLFISTLFFYIPSCLTFPAARHSCFFGLSAVFRIVAHTAVPNSVASYPEGRLLQDSFPLESSFCLSRKDDSFLSSLQALLQWQTWSFIVFIIMMNFKQRPWSNINQYHFSGFRRAMLTYFKQRCIPLCLP